MPKLRNRVKCTTATTGTGSITIGAAFAGFQSFSAAYATDTSNVSYMIEEGSNFEVGRGTYTRVVGAGTLTRTAIENSSNGGAAISLGGSATVAVVFLASENSGDWPLVIVSRNQGGTGGFFSLSNSSAFTTIPINNVEVDTHGGFNTSTYFYTIPQTGYYDIQGKIRLDDNSGAVNFGVGLDVANQDSAGFVWDVFPSTAAQGTNRFVLYNSRTMLLTAGQALRLFSYIDSGDYKNVNKAELTARRVL